MIAAAAGAVAGLLLNTLVIEQFRGRSAITVLIATLGVALIKAGTKINYEGASGDLDYGVFEAADGPLVIAVGNDDIWRRFAPLAGLDPADTRFATNALRLGRLGELQQIMNAALGQRPVAHWLDRLRRAGVPAGELKTLDRVYDGEQARAEDLIWEVDHPRLGAIRLPGHPVHYSRSAVKPGLPPPVLGEHTDELRAAMLDPAQADGG